MSNKKKNHAPIKTREQLYAEKKERDLAAKRKTILGYIITAAVALSLVFTLILFTLIIPTIKAAPGFDRKGNIKDTVYVKMTVKDYGDIILMLDGKTAPITVANFVSLVNSGFYDGLTFHRVISNFMIQGGDPNANGTGGSPNKIKGEFEANGYANYIAHQRGVISMARRGDSYDSASSQFFICNASNDSVSGLDGEYAAFGRVIDGMEVVDLITSRTAYLAEDTNGTIAKHNQAVIEKVVVISPKEANR